MFRERDFHFSVKNIGNLSNMVLQRKSYSKNQLVPGMIKKTSGFRVVLAFDFDGENNPEKGCMTVKIIEVFTFSKDLRRSLDSGHFTTALNITWNMKNDEYNVAVIKKCVQFLDSGIIR